MVDGATTTNVTPYGNMQTYFTPLLRKLSRQVLLPDLVLASNPHDEPEDGGPWVAYCNTPFHSSNLLLPAREGVSTPLRCGPNCDPFTDLVKRQPTAVFLGSSTGWSSGHRQAAVTAGVLHNISVYSGYTKLIDLPASNSAPSDEILPNTTKPKLSLAKQVSKFKYIINADGHCAALRLRHLLASDSVVFWIESNEVEWFYPLLIPYTHYIPMQFDKGAKDPLPDIMQKLAWAERNPLIMAKVVPNTNHFAATHLSDHALTCYSIRLLHEYAALFHDSHELEAVAQAGYHKRHHNIW